MLISFIDDKIWIEFLDNCEKRLLKVIAEDSM